MPVPPQVLLVQAGSWAGLEPLAGQGELPAARGVPKGMESEHPSSPLHANVMCLEMSCQGEPCTFP